MTFATALLALFVFAAVYGFAAVLICLDLHHEHAHWWCPMCAVCGIFARRFPAPGKQDRG